MGFKNQPKSPFLPYHLKLETCHRKSPSQKKPIFKNRSSLRTKLAKNSAKEGPKNYDQLRTYIFSSLGLENYKTQEKNREKDSYVSKN